MTKATVLWGSGLVIFAVLAGCAKQQPDETAAPPGTSGAQDEAAPETSGDGEDNNVEQALAKLPPEERALAEQQEICPVSEEPLGSMGEPVKITVEGQEVFVCCEGCIDMVKEDPDKYLAKLDQDDAQ